MVEYTIFGVKLLFIKHAQFLSIHASKCNTIECKYWSGEIMWQHLGGNLKSHSMSQVPEAMHVKMNSFKKGSTPFPQLIVDHPIFLGIQFNHPNSFLLQWNQNRIFKGMLFSLSVSLIHCSRNFHFKKLKKSNQTKYFE